MADPYVGEIQAFPYPMALHGIMAGSVLWLPCFGQLLPTSAYQALFALIGTSYGGNGTTNFQLPNIDGVVTMSQGQGQGLTNRVLGQTVGSSTVAVSTNEMTLHTHVMQLGAKNATNATAGPGNGAGIAAIDPAFNGFVNPTANVNFAPNAISFTGSSQAHDNNQPTLALVWCIATGGIFPSFPSS